MQIQWFPGHMNKARKQIAESLPQVDLLLEVLDARVPYSSQNPMLNELRGEKPVLKILAKRDLADPVRTEEWLEYFQKQVGVKARAVNLNEPTQVQGLAQVCSNMLPKRKEGNLKTITTMVVGIPNVGKSTLINKLARRTIAKTGDEPAVTKDQQRIQIGEGIVIMDTPGVLWPNIENPNSGFRLAAIGSIKDTAMDYEDAAGFAAKFLLQHYRDQLVERFDLDSEPRDLADFFDTVGRKRGCLSRGNAVDYERVSRILLVELRSGKLGPITMETPEMIELELAQQTEQRDEKARLKREKQKERKARFKAKSAAKANQRKRR